MGLKDVRYTLSAWTDLIPESEIRRLLRFTVKYYLAGGKPGVIPLETFAKILEEVSHEQLEMIKEGKITDVINQYNYEKTAGYDPLRIVLARRLRERDNIPLPSNDEEAKEKVIITTGSQQSLFILGDILIDPGDVIIVPEPAYLGFLGPMMRFGARIVTVPTDDKGIIPEYVEEAIKKSAEKFKRIPDIVYVISDSDNPKGTTLPMERRKRLYEIAEENKILLVEDAAYREIQFRKPLPPIKSLDKENKWVAYLRTTSKEAAVLRVGYCVIPDELIGNFLKSKGYIDLTTPTITQVILKIYYEKYIDKVLPETVRGYERRCKAMIKAIDEHFPEGFRTDPTGGFFVWWESANKNFDAARFLQEVAIPNEVSYVPGAAFYPLPQFGYRYDPDRKDILPLKDVPKNTMRLSYSFLPENLIEEGITRLGKLLSEHLR
ncbi:MAG: aminotransferase-like domain-containing protein [Candidatus Njordarchaeales archaeon]